MELSFFRVLKDLPDLIDGADFVFELLGEVGAVVRDAG